MNVMDLYQIRNALNSGVSIFDLELIVTFYARVSTDKYEQANSLKNQVEYFKEFIGKNTKWTYVQGYIDEGITGTSVNKRDDFLRMIRDAQQGKFHLILTKEISRFSRNTLDSIKYTQELLSYGVGVLFQSDNINTFYPDAELRLTIMSSIAQEEVRKLSERVKFGFKRSIENGVVLGNNVIWGYKKDSGKLMIDEEQAEMVRLIFNLYASEQMGVRGIGRILYENGYKNSRGNEISFSTIKNIISNPKYKGYYCGNKTRIVDYRLKNRININKEDWVMYRDEENVPAIVNEEIWEQANRLLKVRGEKAKNNESAYQTRYTYSGKIFCAEHGTTFHRGLYKYKSGDKEVWQCKEYKRYGKSGCDSLTLYTSELDEILKDTLGEFIINRAEIVQRLSERYETAFTDTEIASQIEEKNREIEKIVIRKDKLLDLNIDGKLSNEEFAEKNGKFNEDINKIRQSILNLEKEKDKIERTRQSLKALHQLIKDRVDGDENDITLVNTALERIVVYKTDDVNRIKLKLFFLFDQSHVLEYTRHRNTTEDSDPNGGKSTKEKENKENDAVNSLHLFVANNTYDTCGYRNRG